MSILNKIQKTLKEKRIPMTVTVEVTKRCNLDCIHCYVDHQDLDIELSIDELKGVIDQLYDIGVLIITLSGGEVFYKKGIWELIEYIRLKKMGLKIITTGTLLTKKDANRLKELGILEVGLSIYSDKAEIHDAVTQKKGSWKKTLDMARYLSEIGVLTVSKTVIMNINYKDVEQIYNLVKSIGVTPQFDATVTDAQNNARDSKKYLLNKNELIELYSNKTIINILHNTKSFEDLYCGSQTTYKDGDPRCNLGRTAMWINAKGEVFPCIQFPYPVGTLKENSLKDIWYNNKKIDKVLEISTYRNYKQCHNCSAEKYCSPCIAFSVREKKVSCNTSSHTDAFARKEVYEKISKKAIITKVKII